MTVLEWGRPIVGIPVAGKTFYHSFAYACPICGAAVIDGTSGRENRTRHEKWHVAGSPPPTTPERSLR